MEFVGGESWPIQRCVKKCGNWVRGRCAKIKRATARFAMHFICSKCKGITEGMVDLIEKLCDEVETVNVFFIWETD